MISGFVIVWTLERCRDWRDFAVSRGSRLYPAYWVAVSITFALGMLAPLPGQAYTAGQYLTNLTMLQDIFHVPALDGAYWSLTVELIFYCYMAAAFALGLLGRLHLICLAWAAACLLTHALARAGIDVPWRIQYYGLLIYGHFLAIGVVLFQIWRRRHIALAWLTIGLCLGSIWLTYIPRDAMVCTIFVALFWLALQGSLRWIVCRPLVWLGSVSYTLYVCHEMIGFRVIATAHAAGLAHLPAVLLALLVVLAVAWLISAWIERPAMRAIRSRWRRRPAEGSNPSTVPPFVSTYPESPRRRPRTD
jgi:peptidoglycan/LPS O-acetylase OafA/YrhL